MFLRLNVTLNTRRKHFDYKRHVNVHCRAPDMNKLRQCHYKSSEQVLTTYANPFRRFLGKTSTSQALSPGPTKEPSRGISISCKNLFPNRRKNKYVYTN